MEIGETLNLIKSHVENIITEKLHTGPYKYLLKEFNLPENCSINVHTEKFSWTEPSVIKENPLEVLNLFAILNLTFRGDISIFSNGEIFENKQGISFNLEIEAWFKLRDDGADFNIRIMDTVLKKAKEYLAEIEQLCLKKGIFSLNDESVTFCGKNSTSFAIDITRKTRSINVQIHDFNVLDDIIRCSLDIKHLFGEVLLLRPYLTNFTSSPMPFNGKIIYTYFPTFVDSRYFRISGLLIESLYNYWDKIGDLLAVYFTTNLPERQIFFSTVIDNIPKENELSNNFIWLKKFKSTGYQQLNTKRIQVVHYKHLESNFHEEYSNNFSNRSVLEQLDNEKKELTEFFTQQIIATIKGFEMTFNLIDEIK